MKTVDQHKLRSLVMVLATSLSLSSAVLAESWRDQLSYRSDDGSLKLRLGGRLHVDGASYSEDVTPMDDDIDIRRGRLSVSGSLHSDWRFKGEYDFAASNDYEIKGTYIGYYGFKKTRIKLGNLQQPIGLEEMTSSNSITFMERSLANALVPSYGLGAEINRWGKSWSFKAGVYDDSIADIKNNNDGSQSLAARMVWMPWKHKGELLHFAISGQLRDVGSNQTIVFHTRPESYLTDARLVSTSSLTDVNQQTLVGLESAFVRGPFSLQGEYIRAAVDRDNSDDPVFDGWYVQGSWFLTGEHRLYSRKSGAFVGVKPRSEWGAVELAARFSQLDLEDASVTGGEESNVTLGVNWYINRYSRMMLNYTAASADPNRNGVKDEPDMIQARYQFVF